MNDTSSTTKLERRARRRVALKAGWVFHAAIYLVVNLGLFLVDQATGGHRWHLWPLAGWGLGLCIHGLAVLVNLRGEGLRERLVAAELARLQAGAADRPGAAEEGRR